LAEVPIIRAVVVGFHIAKWPPQSAARLAFEIKTKTKQASAAVVNTITQTQTALVTVLLFSTNVAHTTAAAAVEKAATDLQTNATQTAHLSCARYLSGLRSGLHARGQTTPTPSAVQSIVGNIQTEGTCIARRREGTGIMARMHKLNRADKERRCHSYSCQLKFTDAIPSSRTISFYSGLLRLLASVRELSTRVPPAVRPFWAELHSLWRKDGLRAAACRIRPD
jgi:hypothetical protein